MKTLNLEHTCGRAFKNPRAQVRWLAKHFKNKVQRSPKYSTTDMRNDLKAEFKLSVSRYKCKRAKREILQEMHGSHKDQYNKFQAYINEIITSDPGTDVCLQLSQEKQDNDRIKAQQDSSYNSSISTYQGASWQRVEVISDQCRV